MKKITIVIDDTFAQMLFDLLFLLVALARLDEYAVITMEDDDESQAAGD